MTLTGELARDCFGLRNYQAKGRYLQQFSSPHWADTTTHTHTHKPLSNACTLCILFVLVLFVCLFVYQLLRAYLVIYLFSKLVS